jgi:hypothetical protein
MKETKVSGTTTDNALSTEKIESKNTWNLQNMLTLGKFSFLLGIQLRYSGRRPF